MAGPWGASSAAMMESSSPSSNMTKADEYATFLRPMGYKSGGLFRFDIPDAESNVVFEADGQLKAGTFSKLVEKMTGKNADPTLTSELLLTYRSFCSPMELFDALVQRFLTAPAADRDIVRIRVTGVIKIWLDKYWYDFGKEEMLLHSMSEFLLFLSSVPGSERTADTLKKTFDKKKDIGDQKVGELVTPQPPPKPIVPQVSGLVVDVLDIHSEELARQLCITEFQLFEKLRPWEFLGQAWSKAGKEQKAPNLLKMIDRFNTVSAWAISEICRCESVKRRAKVLQKMIELAVYLRQYNNYNSLMAIIAALNNSSVSRLKNTFAALPQRVASQLAEVTDLVSQLGNYAKLRNAIHSCTPPLVPYLGMYLTDLTFIDENANTVNGLINFAKRRQIANVIQNEVAQYQQEQYNLEPVASIQQFLANLQYFDDKTNYKLSTWIEPRPGTMRSGDKPAELMMGEDLRGSGSGPGGQAAGASGAMVNGMSLQDDTEPIELEFVQGYRFYMPDAPHNIKRSTDVDTGIVMVHAATVDKLVERLTHERLTDDATFLPAFMAAYRYFVTAYDLLDMLVQRWQVPRPRRMDQLELWRDKKETPIRRRVLGVVTHWIEHYYADFVDEPQLWDKLTGFLELLRQTDPSAAAALQASLAQAMKTCEQNQTAGAGVAVPDGSAAANGVLEFEATELARQLALVTHAAFCQIRPSEAAYGRWRDPDARHEYAPNVASFFQQLSALTANIDAELTRWLTQPHERMGVISRWIEVAQQSLQLNNWAALRAIMFSLDKVYAQELHAVWGQVTPPLRAFFVDARKLAFDAAALKSKFSSSNSSSSSVNMVNHNSPAAVPPLDVPLAEVADLEAQMPDWVFAPDPLVNFDKFNALGKVLAPAFAWQRTSYPFTRVDAIRAWLLRPPLGSEGSILLSRIQNRVPIDENSFSQSQWTSIRAAPSMIRNVGGGGVAGSPPTGAGAAPMPGTPPPAGALPPLPPPGGDSGYGASRPAGPPPSAPKKLPPLPGGGGGLPGMLKPASLPPLTPSPSPSPASPPVMASHDDPASQPDDTLTDSSAAGGAASAGGVSLSNPETRAHVLALLRTSPEIRTELSQVLTEVFEESAQQAERDIAVEAEAHENNKMNPHAEFYRTIQREFPGCKITKWNHNDKQGVVYGFPDQIECDMIKRGDDTFLCDIRSEVLVQNVALLLRIGKLYRTLHPKGSLSCVVVAKTIHPKALAVAQKCKIKLFISSNQ